MSIPRAALLHERDAAIYLNMSVAWLQRARWNRTGPRYVRVGGPSGRAVRYKMSDLEAYVAQNTVAVHLPSARS